MTQLKLLKTQELKSKLVMFSKKNKIKDILVYGSVVRGKSKPNDIDIAIILNQEQSLNSKLLLSQKFRNIFKSDLELDVKVISENELNDTSFIARTGIFAEGYSLLKHRFYHEIYGFKTFMIFDYELTGLTNSQKKILYYALHGRRNNKGLLKTRDAISFSSTIIKVPLVHSEEFKEIFKLHNVSFKNWISMEYVF